jgi:hypothetical protein
MDSLIVTREEMAAYRPISKNIPQERVEVFINEAQVLDLFSILGAPLYLDFITKVFSTGDPMYSAYQDLLNGSTWTINGVSKKHYGLKPIVSYYALARLTKNNQLNLTSYGVTSKINPQSEPVEAIQISSHVKELQSIAVSYQETTLDFLNDNASTYPLFNYHGEVLTKTSLRFIDI